MAKSNEGYSKILVIIDHATKFVIAKPTVDGSAETAARILLFEELICKSNTDRLLNSGAIKENPLSEKSLNI